MTHPLILCCALLAAAPGDGPATESLMEKAIPATPGPDAQVRLALDSEARGLEVERLKHLAIALLLDPGHEAARGLKGLVRVGTDWKRPEAIESEVQGDPTLSARLAEYDRRRSRALGADGHWNLALWCERQGLDDEARAHLTATVRLDPSRESAWRRLGFERHGRRWLTEAQYRAEKAEAAALEHAEATWTPRLAALRRDLRSPEGRESAEAALAGVDDPRSVAAIWKTFAPGDDRDHATAVRLLGQVDAPASTRALALFAAFSPSPSARRAASETLAWRDPRDAAGLLVGLLGDPEPGPDLASLAYRFWIKPVGDDRVGSPGLILVQSRYFDAVGRYTVDESFGRSAYDPAFGNYDRRVAVQQARQWADLKSAIARIGEEARRELLAAEATNRPILDWNDRVLRALGALAKADLGRDPEAWRKWWTEERGFAYKPPEPRRAVDPIPKPTFVQSVHYSCFAAGTPVRTRTGPVPIESVQVGDRVLARDVSTGALVYRPVVSVARNAPASTLRIRTEAGPVVATGIHRFWKASQGWTMARDLRPGDLLRSVDGPARVLSVEAAPVQPVYNLEVLDSGSFFVGDRGLLVHDQSPVEATPDAFDSAPRVASAR